MTKAEREALKAEFITGDYRTIKEFAEAKGIEYNSTFRKMASLERWTKDKNEHLEQIYKKTVPQDIIVEKIRAKVEKNRATLAQEQEKQQIVTSKNVEQNESAVVYDDGNSQIMARFMAVK